LIHVGRITSAVGFRLRSVATVRSELKVGNTPKPRERARLSQPSSSPARDSPTATARASAPRSSARLRPRRRRARRRLRERTRLSQPSSSPARASATAPARASATSAASAARPCARNTPEISRGSYGRSRIYGLEPAPTPAAGDAGSARTATELAHPTPTSNLDRKSTLQKALPHPQSSGFVYRRFHPWGNSRNLQLFLVVR
jgi:hypothetical protein